MKKNEKLNDFAREVSSTITSYATNREDHAWYYFSQTLKLSDQAIADAYGICREAVRKRVTQYARENKLSLVKGKNRKENQNAKNQ